MHVATPRRTYRFGPFALDSDRRRLTRGADPVSLPYRQLDALLLLIASAGEVVPKETLIDLAWHGTAVTDNSIVQAVRGLRQALGDQSDGAPYIETQIGKGYRFIAPVEIDDRAGPAPEAELSEASLTALLDPHRTFVDGRAALETLDRDAVGRAAQTFAGLLTVHPGLPAAHAGMANACLLQFESTRADRAPNHAALERAEHHAREACRLDPSYADAWTTLAVARYRRGDSLTAVAAARKAVALEPKEWRHCLRLAFVGDGQHRLSAACRVLALCPRLALAHWLAATVFVARGAFPMALDHLREGCARQDAQLAGDPDDEDGDRFTPVGLHLLHGLVLAAQGLYAAAHDELMRELSLENSGHVYARECCANAWYAIGALRLQGRQSGHGGQERQEDAAAAFREALARVPGHALAEVGLAAATDSLEGLSLGSPEPPANADPMTAAIVRAAVLTLQGRHEEAAHACDETLKHGPASMGAGWILPVEPLLHVSAHPSAWERTLARLSSRTA